MDGAKAGMLFRCVCCGDEQPEDKSSFDKQLNGPICPDCLIKTRWAVAWMKRSGIDRPLEVRDITDQLRTRLDLESK